MVAKSTSKHVEKLQKYAEVDLNLETALAELKEQAFKPKKERLSLQLVACNNHVSSSTLSQHFNGMQTAAAYFKSCQKITPVEEDVLANMILELADCGFPPTQDQVTEMSNLLLQTQYGPEYQPLGIHWVDQFLNRKWKVLTRHWSKPLDNLHANGLHLENVTDQFSNFIKTFIVNAGIDLQNIYGMDETGF